MSGLSREVIRWIQSLDLTWQVKTPKWDLTNGYLVAEIFSWYFPQEIQMHMFNNGTSLDSKLKNWSLLENFFKRHKLDIPAEYVDGTIHCKEGAATLLVEKIYEILTNRQVRKVQPEDEAQFSDHAYQSKLPMHARSTASKAVKNNLRITELMADKNLILSQQKAQAIINRHVEHRRDERLQKPDRFNIRPTLGELATRRPPPVCEDGTVMDADAYMTMMKSNKYKGLFSGQSLEDQVQDTTVQFKEITVNQMGRRSELTSH